MESLLPEKHLKWWWFTALLYTAVKRREKHCVVMEQALGKIH
jgi:hypothetical protein